MRPSIGNYALAALLASLMPHLAKAQESKPTIAVMGFGGNAAARLRAAAVTSLRAQDVTLADADEVQAAEIEYGVRASSKDGAMTLGEALGIDGFVIGVVRRQGRGWSARVVLRSGHSGQVIRSLRAQDTRLSAVIARVRGHHWPRLRKLPVFSEGTSRNSDSDPPDEEPLEDKEERTAPQKRRKRPQLPQQSDVDTDDDEPTHMTSTPRNRGQQEQSVGFREGWLEGSLGVSALYRRFQIDVDTGERPKLRVLLPGVDYRVAIHPVRRFGLVLSGFRTFSLETDGYPTWSRHVMLAVRYRPVIGNTTVGLLAGYANLHGVLSSSGPLGPDASGNTLPPLPTVDHNMVVLGADAAVQLSKKTQWKSDFGARVVLDRGPAEEVFQQSFAVGVHLGTAIEHAIHGPFSLRLGFTLIYLPMPGSAGPEDRFPGASGSDLYLNLFAGLATRL